MHDHRLRRHSGAPKPAAPPPAIPEMACVEAGKPLEQCFPGGVHHIVLHPDTPPVLVELPTPRRMISVACNSPGRHWTTSANVLLSCEDGVIEIFEVATEHAEPLIRRRKSQPALSVQTSRVIAVDGIAYRIVETTRTRPGEDFTFNYGALMPTEATLVNERPFPIAALNCLLNAPIDQRETTCHATLVTEVPAGDCEAARSRGSATVCDDEATRSYAVAGHLKLPTKWGSDAQKACIERRFREDTFATYGPCGAIGAVTVVIPLGSPLDAAAIELSEVENPPLISCDGKLHRTNDGFAICDGTNVTSVYIAPTLSSPIITTADHRLTRRIPRPSFADFGFGTLVTRSRGETDRRRFAYQQPKPPPPIAVVGHVIDVIDWDILPPCPSFTNAGEIKRRRGETDDPLPPEENWNQPQCRIVAIGEIADEALFASAESAGVSFGSRLPANQTVPCDKKRHRLGNLYLTCDRAGLRVEVADFPGNAAVQVIEAASRRTIDEMLLFDGIEKQRNTLSAILTVVRNGATNHIPLLLRASGQGPFLLSVEEPR